MEPALQVVDNALKLRHISAAAVLADPLELDLFALCAVQQDIHDIVGQLADGSIQGEMVVLRKAPHIHGGNGTALHGPAAGLQTAFIDGKPLIGNDQLGIDAHEHPQACTLLAGPEGVVEGEHSGGKLVNADAVLRAGIILGEGDVLSPLHADHHNTAGEPRRHLDRVGQAGADIGLYHQPVHHDFNGMLLVLFQGNGLVQVVDQAVHPGADKAGAPGGIEFLLVLSLSAPHGGGQHLNFTFFRQRQHLIHDLIHRLLLDLPAADGAVGNADASVKKPKIIVNFRHRSHGGAGILGGGLLVDGNGGGKAVDQIHIGLFHLPQKHSGIGGKAFHIPALPLGVNGIKGQRRFARTGKPSQNHQLVPGDRDVDPLQIVLSGPMHYNFIKAHCFLLLSFRF